ncbi:hypothetical protein AC579_483 [Pseudocercospora musae]|uniref:Uncharacterized protein n=1 Tax=Pseudocercospora musae TaxID=113226 RepID=A0A139IP06_9PEZI|nr:hypothetical protein AC579_483 [Pseudocercospora musae]
MVNPPLKDLWSGECVDLSLVGLDTYVTSHPGLPLSFPIDMGEVDRENGSVALDARLGEVCCDVGPASGSVYGQRASEDSIWVICKRPEAAKVFERVGAPNRLSSSDLKWA